MHKFGLDFAISLFLQIPSSPITPLIAVALYSYPGVLSKNLTKVEKLQQRAKLEATKVSTESS